MSVFVVFVLNLIELLIAFERLLEEEDVRYEINVSFEDEAIAAANL